MFVADHKKYKKYKKIPSSWYYFIYLFLDIFRALVPAATNKHPYLELSRLCDNMMLW